MNTKKIKEYKNGLRLSNIQREILVGTIIGDGHLNTWNGREYKLMIQHALSQKDYVDWKYQHLRDWVRTPPKIKDQIVKGKLYHKVWFNTLSHSAFRFYGQQFYPHGKKVVPRLIAKWLTPLGVAVWFMDYGSIKSKDHRALILNTQSYSNLDLSRLQTVLLDKFGVKTKLRRQKEGQQIYLLAETVATFVSLIKPFIIPTMMYKLGKLR